MRRFAEAMADADYADVCGNGGGLVGSAQAEYDRYVGAALATAEAKLAWAAAQWALDHVHSAAEGLLAQIGIGGDQLPVPATPPDDGASLQVKLPDETDFPGLGDTAFNDPAPYAGMRDASRPFDWQKDQYAARRAEIEGWGNTLGGDGDSALSYWHPNLTGWDENSPGTNGTNDPTTIVTGGVDPVYPMGAVHAPFRHAIVNLDGDLVGPFDELRPNAIHQPHYQVNITPGSNAPFQTDAPPQLSDGVNDLYGDQFDCELTEFDEPQPNGGVYHWTINDDGQWTWENQENVGDQGQPPPASGSSSTASNSASTSVAPAWTWDEVLGIIQTLDGGCGYFWGRKGRFVGYGGPAVSAYYVGGWAYGGAWLHSVEFKVPANWTSVEVAKYLVDNTTASWVYSVLNKPGIDGDIKALTDRVTALDAACKEIGGYLETGVRLGVGLIPGGQFVLVIEDLSEGRIAGAAIGSIGLVPWSKIPWAKLAKIFGLEKIVFRFRGKEIAVAKEVMEDLGKLEPAEIEAIEKEIANNLAGKSAKEIEEAIAKGAREAAEGKAVEEAAEVLDGADLAKNLEESVRARLPGEQAAHIIPQGDWSNTHRSAQVREMIANSQAKVRELLPGGIDSYYNGFWAKPGHLGTHTDKYFETMWKLLKDARSENEVVSALDRLRKMAENGAF